MVYPTDDKESQVRSVMDNPTDDKESQVRSVMDNPTDDKENRIRSVMDNLIGTEDPDDLMLELLGVLEEGGKVPESGRYYVFVYNPKTPNIRYDQNPLVAVSDVFTWGFRGINLHWGEVRQYTWNEIVGQIYEIYSDELADVQEIPFAKYRLNS